MWNPVLLKDRFCIFHNTMAIRPGALILPWFGEYSDKFFEADDGVSNDPEEDAIFSEAFQHEVVERARK